MNKSNRTVTPRPQRRSYDWYYYYDIMIINNDNGNDDDDDDDNTNKSNNMTFLPGKGEFHGGQRIQT